MFFGSKKKDGAAVAADAASAASQPATAQVAANQAAQNASQQTRVALEQVAFGARNAAAAADGAAASQPGALTAQVGTATAADVPAQQLDPELLAKISAIRTRLHETFGKVSLALMMVPRYRNLSISDLSHLVLDPLMRDRIAIATSSKAGDATDGTLSGIAIWASVSPDVDARIREQIRAGIFPVRLKPEDWNSGEINWLLDVIAPNQRLTTAVIANFRQVVTQGEMRIHPIVTRLVDPEALKKMGAAPISTTASAPPPRPTHGAGHA